MDGEDAVAVLVVGEGGVGGRGREGRGEERNEGGGI